MAMKLPARLEESIASSLDVAPEVSLASFRVADMNGDQDGYPDSNETVDLFVTIRNPTRSQNLTNVVVELTTADPTIDCIVTASGNLGLLPAGAEVEIPTPFRLHIHPLADRAGPTVTCNNPGPSGTCSNFVEPLGGCISASDCYRTALQSYSSSLNVSITSDQQPAAGIRPQRISLDLDLNSKNPSIPTAKYVEGFESGLDGFVFQNLDSNKASNSASDGYRCQYNDPDFVNSNSYGVTECYLGFATGQFPVNDWHLHTTSAPDGGRAFEGTRSLHYGKHTSGNPSLDTYGLSHCCPN